jgi:hypothetical protein
MKARDVFGLMVRLIGLGVLLYSLWYLVFAIASSLKLLCSTTHDGDTGVSYALEYYAFGVLVFIIGMLILRFSREMVRFSYPKNKDDADD